MRHVGMSQSATAATRNEATRRLKPPRVTTFAELARGTAVGPSSGCLRTVADAIATTSEDTLNPQIRELVLRIREIPMKPNACASDLCKVHDCLHFS